LGIIEVLVVLVGVIAAFQTWKWQTYLDKELDVATEAINRCDDLERAIDRIRWPGVSNSELVDLKGLEPGQPRNFNRETGHAKHKRLEEHRPTLEKVRELRGRFLAYFGDEFDEAFKETEKLYRDMTLASQLYGGNPRSGSQEHMELHKRTQDECASLLNFQGSDDDIVKSRLRNSLGTIRDRGYSAIRAARESRKFPRLWRKKRD
jgi:hypothetical protein